MIITLGTYKFVAIMIGLWIIISAITSMRDGQILRNLAIVIVTGILLVIFFIVVVNDLSIIQIYINE